MLARPIRPESSSRLDSQRDPALQDGWASNLAQTTNQRPAPDWRMRRRVAQGIGSRLSQPAAVVKLVRNQPGGDTMAGGCATARTGRADDQTLAASELQVQRVRRAGAGQVCTVGVLHRPDLVEVVVFRPGGRPGRPASGPATVIRRRNQAGRRLGRERSRVHESALHLAGRLAEPGFASARLAGRHRKHLPAVETADGRGRCRAGAACVSGTVNRSRRLNCRDLRNCKLDSRLTSHQLANPLPKGPLWEPVGSEGGQR